MSLTRQDLRAIKQLIDDSIDERVPTLIDTHVQPMFDRLEKRLTTKVDQLTLDVGQFSLETTDNFTALNARIDDLDDGLAVVVEMADNNRVEIRKVKHKLGIT